MSHSGCPGMGQLLTARDSRGPLHETRSPVVSEWGSGHVGEGGWCRWLYVQVGLNDATFRWLSLLCGSEGQFSENSAQKDRQEHRKTPRCWCWFGGRLVANHRGGCESSVVVTTLNISGWKVYCVQTMSRLTGVPWRMIGTTYVWLFSEPFTNYQKNAFTRKGHLKIIWPNKWTIWNQQ